MTKRISPKWYVQEDQKIKGPYTPLEIQSLLTQGKIHGKSFVSGGPKDNHSKTVNDLVQSLADPTYSLFSTLKFAQNITNSLSQEIAKTPLKQYKSKIGVIFWMGGFLLLILATLIIYFDKYHAGISNPFQSMMPSSAGPLIYVGPAGLKPKTTNLPKPLLPKRPEKSSNKLHTEEEDQTLRESHPVPLEYKGEPKADNREDPKDEVKAEVKEELREDSREEVRGELKDASHEGIRNPASFDDEKSMDEPTPAPPSENNTDLPPTPIDLSE